MTWSTKLQSGTGGVQGYNEWETIYDPAVQTNLRVHYKFSLGNIGPEVLYHTPDNGSPIPVRANGRNRLIFLTLDTSKQTTWDAVTNLITPLARLVDGPDSQAARAQIDETVEPVRVKITPDGATYATYYEVLHGFIDTSTAFTDSIAVLNKMARQVTIALTCKPFGYGDTFGLRNDLASSPHMIEDSDADGTADGLIAIGAPTLTLDTGRFLTGGQSQKVVTDASSTEGIRTESVTASTSTDFITKIAISADSTGNDTIRISATNGVGGDSEFIDFNPASPANYSATYIGSDGAMWYVFDIAGSNPSSANARIYVQRISAAATQATTFWVAWWYMRLNTTSAPPAFASSASLKNRYDPAATSAATQQQINYLDIWGVPGDVPAHVNFAITQTANFRDGFMAAAVSDGVKGAHRWYYWLDSQELAVLTGTLSKVTGTGTSRDNYIRWTNTGSAQTNYPTGTPYPTDSLGWTNFDYLLAAIPARVYAIGRTSNLGNLLRFSWSGASTGTNEYTSFKVTNTWELIDLGMMNTTSINRDGAKIIPSLNITFSTGTLDVDALIFVPTNDEKFIITPQTLGTAAIPEFDINGVDNYVTHTKPVGLVTGADIIVPHMGALRIAEPGVMTRFFFFLYGVFGGNLADYDITSAYTITASITPRTSHLLGTV